MLGWDDRGSCDVIKYCNPDKIRDSAGDPGFGGMQVKYYLQRWKCDEDDNVSVNHALGRQLLDPTSWLSFGILVMDHAVDMDETLCVPICRHLSKSLGGKRHERCETITWKTSPGI